MDTTQDFFNAVKFGDGAAVKTFLAGRPALVHVKNEGATALHFAALQGHSEIVDILLEGGADMEARDDEFNATPIGWANERGHMTMVQYLSDHGALVAIDRAAAFGMIDLIREYILEGTDHLNTVGGFGAPLHEASLWGYPAIVGLLLDSGADPKLESADGRTAHAIAKSQIATGGGGTPLVSDVRRREIIDGCSAVVETFRQRGIAS